MKRYLRRLRRRHPKGYWIGLCLIMVIGVSLIVAAVNLKIKAIMEPPIQTAQSSKTVVVKNSTSKSVVPKAKSTPPKKEVVSSSEKQSSSQTHASAPAKSQTQAPVMTPSSSEDSSQAKPNVSSTQEAQSAPQTFKEKVIDVNGHEETVTLTAPKTTVEQPTNDVQLPISGSLQNQNVRFYILDKSSSWEEAALKNVNTGQLDAYGYIQDSNRLKAMLGESTWLELGHYLAGNSPLLVAVENNQLTLKGKK